MNVGILTVSDRSYQGLRPDTAGPALRDIAERKGWTVAATEIVPDDRELIAMVLKNWADHRRLDMIFTTGGTGIGPRDVTPDTTKPLLDKELSGLAAYLMFEGMKTNPNAVLSRAVAGVRGKTIVLNLPGNPKGAADSLARAIPLLEHAHAMVLGDNHDHR